MGELKEISGRLLTCNDPGDDFESDICKCRTKATRTQEMIEHTTVSAEACALPPPSYWFDLLTLTPSRNPQNPQLASREHTVALTPVNPHIMLRTVTVRWLPQ